jgi:DnaJ-class molecular chaperone
MRDPYDVLGVRREASAADIKSAYRRLAKKLHPDANKQDPKAASRFAELNAAYEILGEADKRKAFDNGEIDAEGKPRFRGFEGFSGQPGQGGSPGGGFETFTWGPEGAQQGGGRRAGGGGFRGFGGIDDILKDMFGAGAGARPRARAGTAHPFEAEEFELGQPSADITAAVTITLPEAAQGTSRRVRLPTGKEVDVKFPAGLTEGQTIRLKGQGLPGPRKTAGDALITVSIAPHPLFAREGNDLRLDVPITLYEAVLGAKVRVPTLDGAVSLAVPAATSSGRVFRLRGKGFPAKDGAGDLLVTVRIALPDKRDPDLDELMKRWRDDKPYDPRKDLG